MDAFTEWLALVLKPFDVRVSIVLPGRSPETALRQNARAWTQHGRGTAVPEGTASWRGA